MAEWYETYLDAWSRHDGDGVASFMAEDARYEDLTLHEVHTGRAEIRDFCNRMEKEFSSDVRFVPGSFQQSGDSYAGEWRMVGTHDGAGGTLPPSGKTFDIPGVSIGRLEGGKIKENRDYWDMATFLGQIGLMPAPEAAATS